MTFELDLKILKNYLELEEYIVKSPRETIKQAFKNGLINNCHIWMEALTVRNLTTHIYDEKWADKLIYDIVNIYFPELKLLHDKLEKQL